MSNVYFVSYPSAAVSNVRVTGKTPEEILASFKGLYSELADAQVVVNGDQVTFSIKDGSKA